METVYVDGACSHNGKGAALARAGYGVYYGPMDPRNTAAPLPPPPAELQTNNRAELRAVIHVIQAALRDLQEKEREQQEWMVQLQELSMEKLTELMPRWWARERQRRVATAATSDSSMLHEDSGLAPTLPVELLFAPPSALLLPQLHIYTDSMYVVNGLLDFSKTWVLRDYKTTAKREVLNLDLWKYLIALRDCYNTVFHAQQLATTRSAAPADFKDLGTKRFTVFNTKNQAGELEGIVIYHVRGHGDSPGNIEADRLAVLGAKGENRV